jgi:cell fate regulator YaaT (PSP1 superfamily)
MAKIIGVRFQPRGNLFYCDANDIPLQVGNYVVVETSHGWDLAKVTISKAQVQTSDLSEPLMTVIRRAQPEDLEKARQDKEKEALAKCKEMVTTLSLRMKPLSAHYNLDGSHLTIFFSARERVDFRNLVRKLSRSLKTRMELRQIGPRDEAKLVGSIGRCGYPLCCQSFLTGFTPVSIRMAKQQDLALNPAKISGICGRLLCCLSYESKQYATLRGKMPQVGQAVSTPFGKAKVVSVNPLKETVTIEFDNVVKELPLDQLNEKPRRG